MSFKEIKDFVPKVLKTIGVTEDNYVAVSVLERELAGLHPHARVVGIRKNRIYVEVESPAHFQEVHFMRRGIAHALQSAMSRSGDSQAPELKVYIKGTSYPDSRERKEFPKKQGGRRFFSTL
ncbi:MAG: DUF721 domain-containing protein [Elusimicrobia bacterium]|nr:DUF721 domain-containing protein [Elusimicrobiota bacterium]